MSTRSENIKRTVGLEWLLSQSGVELLDMGSGVGAHCPFHQPDNNPSFYIWQNDRGIDRYGCNSCSANGTVIDWVMHHRKTDIAGAMDYLEGLDLSGVAPPARKPHKEAMLFRQLPECEAKHTYRNKDGTVLGIVCRRPKHPSCRLKPNACSLCRRERTAGSAKACPKTVCPTTGCSWKTGACRLSLRVKAPLTL